MPRGKKSDLAKALEVLGVSLDSIPQEAVKEQTEYEALEDSRTLEAESVLFYLETKGAESIWKKRTCKQCGKKFLSSYTGVSLCTDECRKLAFAEKGMAWDPTGRTEAERWGGTIPRIIGPTATEKLEGMTFPNEPKPKEEKSSPVEKIDDIDDWLNSMG